ncbi:hypothetical protein [Bosea rubneri]|uniref:Uncharacterized protein n=1 Tax=Bosea rubneri TaxID=3075434 RepID=A0ABU3SES5_9HYPH|nr:hypothetical protein [Bosea sp. ZW T0_25]MDU0343166.1 hypothetical protein [Bosea sp. ZW T0_25]
MRVIEARNFGGSFMPDGFSPFGLVIFAAGLMTLVQILRSEGAAGRQLAKLASAIACMLVGAAAFFIPMVWR